VTGPSQSLAPRSCFVRIRSRVAGGGAETYCLERFSGAPGPRAVVRDSGVVTFRLPSRTIRARVHVVERFAADGTHARQTLTGTLVGASGTITGGGTDTEKPPGHIAASNLRYVVVLRPPPQP
jgi:hypothetical protein